MVQPIVQGAEKNKDDRIAGVLQPRYASGWVRHQKILPRLEAQLMDFPTGKKDYADACAMMMALLGESQGLAAPEDAKSQDEYDALPPLPPSPYEEGLGQIFEQSAQAFDESRYRR